MPGLIDCNVRSNTQWESQVKLTERGLRGGNVVLFVEEGIHSFTSFQASTLYTDVVRVPVVQTLADVPVRNDAICKVYLTDPSHIVKATRDLPAVFATLTTKNSTVIIDCNFPEAHSNHLHSPLRAIPLEARTGAELPSVSTHAAGFLAEVKSSGDEEDSDSPLEPMLAPELASVQASIHRRKTSNVELINKELGQYSGSNSSASSPVDKLNLVSFSASSNQVMKGGRFRPPPINACKPKTTDTYQDFVLNYPDRFETNGVHKVIELLRMSPVKAHLAALSSSEAVLAAHLVKEDLGFTVETAPHYLCLASNEITPDDTRFKVNPPVRNLENQLELHKLLELGGINVVSSMHEYILPAFKALDSQEFKRAVPGIPTLGHTLSALWTRLLRDCSTPEEEGRGLVRLVRAMSQAPAERFGLRQYGCIAPDCFANLIIYNPSAAATKLYSDSCCPYEDFQLQGTVEKVYIRGQVAFEHGQCQAFGRDLSS